jgi:hypothetical protein
MNRMQERFRFFHEHAGYVVGQRAIGAWELAKAEEYAEEAGWVYCWDYDQDADRGPVDWGWSEADVKRWESTEHRCYVAYLLPHSTACVRPLASLGGIWDPSREYERVVNAELALEALAREEAKRKREGTSTLWEPVL